MTQLIYFVKMGLIERLPCYALNIRLKDAIAAL